MQLLVSGKHLDVGDSLRGHVTEAVAGAAERYFGRAIEGKVVFQRARHAFRADISLHVARGISVQAHGEAEDPYIAFDQAMDRLNKRLRRHKRRLVARRKEKTDDLPIESAPYFVLAVDPSGDGETAAGVSTGANGDGQSGEAPLVVAEMSVDIPALSVSDAVMCLDLSDTPVLMFRNRAHGGYNVVYRRADGTIGWIDPTRPGAQAA